MSLLWMSIILLSYVLGSIPFGYIIGRRCAGIDITRTGSGNIGATNIAREAGLKYGVATLVLDMLKGVLPALVADLVSGTTLACLSGLMAVLGHQFSLFMHFRGGKGVATAIGFYLIVSPLQLSMALILFLITVMIWDFISLGSMVLCLSMPLLLLTFGKTAPAITISGLITALIIWSHRGNLQRIIKGEERRWRNRDIR